MKSASTYGIPRSRNDLGRHRRHGEFSRFRELFVGVSILAGSVSASAIAIAHEAPKGWSYPFACCSGYDCREVSSKQISEKPEGYIIAGTGELVGYSDARIRESPDGEYHWCSIEGRNDSKTICLFVPPRSY